MANTRSAYLVLAPGVVLRRFHREVVIRAPGEGEHLVLPLEEEVALSVFSRPLEPLEALKIIANTTTSNVSPARFREVVEMGVARGILEAAPAGDSVPAEISIEVLPPVSKPLVIGLCVISAALCAAGLVCLFTRGIDIPDTWDRVILFWLLTCVQLSLDGVIGALVGKLFKCQVRKPDFHFQAAFFCWDFDESDTIMAGRLGEVTCVLCRLAVSCAMVTMSNVFIIPTLIPSVLVALLVEANPFGYNLVPRVVAALFQKDRNLGLSAVTFLKKKAIGQIFEWSGGQVRNQAYYLVYATYAIIWLGNLIMVSKGIIIHFVPLLHVARTMGQSMALPGLAIGWSILVVVAIMIFMIKLVLGGLARGKRAILPRTERVRTTESTYSPDEIAQFLQKTPLLSQMLMDFLGKLAESMHYARVDVGGKIIMEGEIGRALYFIYDGEVTISKENEVGDPVDVARLGRGDIFGEIALLEKVRRTAGVTAFMPTELFVLPKQAFDSLLLAEVGAGNIRRAIQVCAFLKKSELFADWVDRELMEASAHFQSNKFQRGDNILTQGQANDSLFLIYEGQVVVSKDGQIVAELGRGDFFGEISLLRSVPVTADITAATDVIILSLPHEDFASLCLSRSTAVTALQKTVDQRTGQVLIEGGEQA